jgi:sarcosine oxidase
MDKSFDVIIIGLGAMGSSTAFHLAKNNIKVLGIDQYKPPHTCGSSHGSSRVIREAYYEHPLYVPIVQRAYELWFDLEKESGAELFCKTGGLMIGRNDSELVKGAKHSAELHKLEHKYMGIEQLREGFPAFNLADDMVAVWEPRAGVLFPEKCIETNLKLAGKYGAVLNYNEQVVEWKVDNNEVTVITDQDSYKAPKLVFSAGSWLPELVPQLNLPLQIERQVLYWFEPDKKTSAFDPDKFPIYIWEAKPDKIFYGFPDLGEGVKIANHHRGEITTPDKINREVKAEEIDEIKEIIKEYLPAAQGKLISSTVCMYTDTPDFNFLIDFHPQFKNIVIASPCSGHGFKFSSAIGEIVKDLLLTGNTVFDLEPFKIKRFTTFN